VTTDFKSIPAMALAFAERYRSAPAVVDGDTTLTFDRLAAEMMLVARGLMACAVQPGDRIGRPLGTEFGPLDLLGPRRPRDRSLVGSVEHQVQRC
jgi:hypothetical protein